MISDLTNLGRTGEARQRLPVVRRLAERTGGELDLNRVVWLEANVYAAEGDYAEARSRLEHVRKVFERPELSYDYALASVDLSLVLLRQGETARVRVIADEMLWIFRAQQVHEQALAALRIFCEAGKRETATVELTRRVARYLHRARYDPALLFEQAGAE